MNTVLYINKPKGITSFDVCYKLRKVFSTKRIGHTGTLDPNATGVMVVLVDSATKAAQFISSDTKQYKARVLFGIETDTLDITGSIIKRQEYILPDKQEIINALNSFLGESRQTVPLTSAKKIDGKKLYEYQRDNKDVKLPEIDIFVSDIELNNINDDGFDFTVDVSSGTYIRSLVRDICKKLNLIGTTAELCRTRVNDISIDECDDLNDVLMGNYTAHSLLDTLSREYKTYEIEKVDDVKNGKRLQIDSNEDKLLITNSNNLLAVYGKDNNEYKCIRGLW